MKKVTIILLLLMGAINIKAQDYHPLVEDGKQWNVLFSYPWSPPEPQHKYTDLYKIEGDTLVDGVPYKVMYTTRNENLTGWNFCGIIRETEDKQAFYRRYGSPDEEMLYDFSMEVGDTICMCDYGYDGCCMVVIEKGETIVNGEPRQQIVLEYPFGNGEEEVWIEGIGSLYGIVDSGSLFLTGGSTNLLCYYEDGDLIWHNTMPGFDMCYIINPDGIEEDETSSVVSVFPNPSKGKVTIEGVEVAEVKVYNALGQLVKIVRETNEIDVAGLLEGVYLLRVKDAKGTAYTERITVTK
jgi:hypothetical protein